MESAGSKRLRSPATAETPDQLVKRLRMNGSLNELDDQKISAVEGRENRLTVDQFVPDEGCKADQPSNVVAGPLSQGPAATFTEGICAEPQAMIAVTAVEPPPPASPDKRFERQTGRNTMPLGGPVCSGAPPAGLLSDQKPPVNFDQSRSSSIAGEQEMMQYEPRQLEAPRTMAHGFPVASYPADHLMGFDTSSEPPSGPRSIRGYRAPGQAPNGPRARDSPYQSLTYASSLPMNDPARSQFSGPPLPTISPNMAEPGFHGQMRAVPELHPPSVINPQDGVLSMTKGAIKQARKMKISPEQTSDIGAQPIGIWSDLCNHVYKVVRGAQDSSRIQNNGFDTEVVDARIKQALNMVKPLIVRQQARHRPEGTTFSQVKIEAAPGAQYQEPQADPPKRKKSRWDEMPA